MKRWWHELRLLRRDRSAQVLLILWCAALIYALATGWQVQSQASAQIDAFRIEGLKKIDDLRAAVEKAESGGTPVDADAAFRLRGPATMPSTPLSFLAVGESDLRPRTANVSLFTTERNFSKGYELQSPVTLAVGRFDLTFAVVALLPLVLIGLCYTQLAEDRERQRLPLLTATGSVGRLLMRRLLLRAALIILPLIIMTTLAAWVAGGAPALPGLLGWLAMTLAWTLLWLTACAWVGARARHAGSAATLLVSFWLLVVLLLPAMLNALSQTLMPPPSALQAMMAARNIEVEADRQRELIVGKYVSDHPELNVNTARDDMSWARRYYMQQQFIEQSLAPGRAAANEALQRQRALQQTLDWMSPAQLLERALTRSAGTDAARHDAFTEQLRTFKRAWDAPLIAPLLQSKNIKSSDLAAWPRFDFVEPKRPPDMLVVLWLLALAGLCAVVTRWPRAHTLFSKHAST